MTKYNEPNTITFIQIGQIVASQYHLKRFIFARRKKKTLNKQYAPPGIFLAKANLPIWAEKCPVENFSRAAPAPSTIFKKIIAYMCEGIFQWNGSFKIFPVEP